MSWENQKITVQCPSCGAKLDITIKQITNKATVKCPRGHSIKLTEKGDSKQN